MSLESLSSLKQLVQVREQGASIQNDNLETAQRQVQQVGTGEAKRVDELNLETAKAEYEVALTQARVDRLQSQLDRESKAVKNAEFITAGVAVLSVGSNLTNLFQDMNGAQKFGDQKNGNLGERVDKDGNKLATDSKGNLAKFDEKGNEIDKDKDPSGYMSGKIKVLDASGNEVKGDFKEDDFKGRSINGKNFKGAGSEQITTAVTGDTSASATYNVAKDEKGNLSIIRTPFSGAGDIGNSDKDPSKPNTGIRAGFISKADLDKEGVGSFQELMAKDPKKADELFTKNSRDLQRNEADTAIGAIGGGGETTVYFDKNNQAITDPDEIKKMKKSIISNTDDFAAGMKQRVERNLEATGVSGGKVGAMDALKYGANAVVSIVSDVSPFFQAYLKMKDQRDKTADELQAEIAKLAAGRKRLKALEDAIRSPGAGADGSAAGAGQAAKN